ncbi:MAG: hypothetical protein ACO1OB_00285 [Archangium sp.]
MRLLPFLFLCVACGVSTSDSLSESSAELQAGRCLPYPRTLSVGPNGQAAARAELDTFAPQATLDWSPVRNTPSMILGLQLELKCPHGKDAEEVLFEFVSQHPTLFRIDPKEWSRNNVPCEAVATTQHIGASSRVSFANQPVAADRFGWSWAGGNERITVYSFLGSWIPTATIGDEVALRSCPSFDAKSAEQKLPTIALPYSTFQWCSPTGNGEYFMQSGDTFTPDATEYLTWNESLLLRKQLRVSLRVAPQNHTPELLSSDANCPDENHQPRVGFSLSYDAVTGELLDVKPGIECIVCLTP